jgi:hypothetical protein
MISPYHPELYTWLRVVKIRLALVVNFGLTFRVLPWMRKMSATSGLLLRFIFISALLLQIEIIKRAFKLDKPFRDDVKVYGGCFYG